MPVRRWKRPFEATPEARQAVRSLEAWERLFGGPAEGRAAWRALGPQLVRPGPHRPEIWWAYTVNVPVELREALEAPDPRWCLVEGAVAPPGYYTRVRRWRGQQFARLEWLTDSGWLNEEEVQLAERHILALRRAIAELPA